ncbi:MAG: hypothetical protein C0514_05950 [Candidatus Puniceispirillum sp.]|nr:hypothetical protein [Candidatus Puniceispirillum sp.]
MFIFSILFSLCALLWSDEALCSFPKTPRPLEAEEDVSPYIFRKTHVPQSPLRSPLSRSREILSPRTWEGVDLRSSQGSPCPSPLRPCSPNPVFEEYGQVGDAARPGAGVEITQEAHNLIEAALIMAAYYAPPIDAENIERVRQFCQRHAPFPEEEERYSGDWTDLEERLRIEGKTHLPLIAYGSLMDDLSSGEFAVHGPTVWAFGAVRSFDFIPPSPETSPFGMPHKTREGEILRLLATYTGSYDNHFNGRLMYIALGEELNALRTREKGYDLVRLPAVRFGGEGRRVTMHLEHAYVLMRPLEENDAPLKTLEVHPNKKYGVTSPALKLLPHDLYLYGCMRGAKSLNQPRMAHGLSHFLNTTYVETQSLQSWLKERASLAASRTLVSPRKYFHALKENVQSCADAGTRVK